MKKSNEYKQQFLVDSVLVITCLSAVLGLAGCQQEGAAEKAGQKIDRAAENATLKIEQATENANQKIEAAKQSVDQKAYTAGQYINQTTDASKGALEQAGQRLDRATDNAQQKIEQSTEKAANELEDTKESVIKKAETAGEYIDDSIITLKVKTEILNDSLLKGSKIEVTTLNGVVNLSGTVDSEQSIGRAMQVANGQQNVKSVQTELIVDSSTLSK